MNSGNETGARTADIAIVGAGPYGLSLAAHLRPRVGHVRIFGDPMKLWRTQMPKGMRLKSEGFASNLYDPDETFTLAHYCAQNDIDYADEGVPVKLSTFSRYGMAFQRKFAPDLENRTVTEISRNGDTFSLRFADGGHASSRRVVVAAGISHFAHIPPVLAGLPAELVSHASHHHELDAFAGKTVAVIGAGASAIDIASLLQSVGAHSVLVARTTRLAFHTAPAPRGQTRPLKERLRWPSSGIGNGWKSYLCAEMPLAFRAMPERFRLHMVRTHLGPAPCWFTRDEVEGKVEMRLGRSLERAEPEAGRLRLWLRSADGTKEELLVDHVIAGTGYRVDLDRLSFIPDALRKHIALVARAPALSSHFESSVPGLYFVGPVSANMFGPLTRFAFGAGFAAARVTDHVNTRH